MKSFILLLLSTVTAYSLVNGNFETGTFEGWVQGGGIYREINNEPVHADLNINWGKSKITTKSDEDWKSLYNLSPVYAGNYSARINNSDDGYHYSTISQKISNWDAPYLSFAWAAVLELPVDWNTHNGILKEPGDIGPHFSVTLDTYFKEYSVYTLDVPIHVGEQNHYTYEGLVFDDTWLYTDWQIAKIDTKGKKDFTLTILASDCGWGGHGGYLYVDNFTAVPEPTTLFAGIFVLLLFIRNQH